MENVERERERLEYCRVRLKEKKKERWAIFQIRPTISNQPALVCRNSVGVIEEGEE
jgi:hypothetical protein